MRTDLTPEVVLATVIVVCIAFLAYQTSAAIHRARELGRADQAPEPLPVVAVKTRTDTILVGRLRSRDGTVLVLAGAMKLDETQPNAPPSSTPLDGDVVIPWDNVDWWQEGLPAELLHRG